MRRADSRLGALCLFALVWATPAPARAQSQEEKRRHLQEQLGIAKPPSHAPDAGVGEQVDAAPAPTEGPRKPAAPQDKSRPNTSRPRAPTFVDDARPILMKRCATCHRPDGLASKTRWVLRGAPEDHEVTLRFVQPANAAQSPLLRKGTGATLHVGKKSLAPDSAEYATLLQWIEAGAPAGRTRTVATRETDASTPATSNATPHPAPPLASTTSPAPATSNAAQPPTSGTSTAPATSNAAQPAFSSTGSAPVASNAAQPPASATSPAPVASAPSSPANTDTPATESPTPSAPRFAPLIHDQLLASCSSCHSAEGLAASSRYLTHSDPAQHLRAVLPLVQPGSATTSLLYQRARGDAHPVGAVWEQGSAELARLAQWIDSGAQGAEPAAPRVDTTAATVPSAPVATEPASPAQHPPTAGPTATATPPAQHPPMGGPPAGVSLGTYPLLGSLTLNGRFDLNYERVNYNDNPFRSEARNALRSYHHFLFLTRQSTTDPVTLTVEMLSLQFWEVGYHVSGETWPVKVFAKGGKILVPFGGEPLFHHSYGGLAAFDQKVLPAVFAREGLTANVQHRQGPFLLSADAYVIAGYQLRRADALLNLQSDFAPLEETRLGIGSRLGASWGPISLWYSSYFNSLGFGRRLFLQALDVAVWRPRGVPVLERFSLGAGLLRADISGGEDEGYGGPGADYYHFASYLQLRFHPTDWLYLQYRQGLRTFGNRRGRIQDSTAFTHEDGSSHNLGVVARWKGLSAGLYQYWNLEKVDEVPDDFTRLVVAYDF